MTPSQYRDGAPDVDVRFAVAQCTLGAILVAASEKGVCAIEFADDPDALVRRLQDRFHAAHMVGDDAEFADLVARVVALVEDPGGDHVLPLDIRGTAFQERVWHALRNLPPGATTTYAEVAARIGAPRATRAVAGACAANHLAVAIPCHRVVAPMAASPAIGGASSASGHYSPGRRLNRRHGRIRTRPARRCPTPTPRRRR